MRQTNRTFLLIVLSAAFLAAQTDPPGRVGRLNYTQGPVSFQPAGVTDWVDAEVNRPLTSGDQVWVGAGGRAEIHVGSAALRLNSNSAFQFLNLDDQTIQIQLSQGSLTVRARNLAQQQILEVDTPSLAFTVLRPGEYRIDANPDSQTTTVTVRYGEGEVTGGGQTFPVHDRQQAIVVGADQLTYNLVPAPAADGWDQWSSLRDRREDESPSARYVSREMGGYEDLDQYGSWASQPGYGQVWMPTSVSAGWAPYHDGHWAWIAPWGWTWVDDAPWGFAPYHYGRWASFGGRWGWVPGPYGVAPMYAPALVGWVGGGRGGSGFSMSFSFGTAAAVGWFPLGPREPYFPSYHVSSGYFGRVNNANTVINNTTINNYYNQSRNPNNPALNNMRYANRNVQNAVTAIPQDRFANGHRVAESARAATSAQLASARHSSAPEIAPQRASVLGPQAGQASRAPHPPAAAMSRPVVARTAPPPASVPFDRQQAQLNQNPGRPLPTATVQEMGRSAPARTAPVRVQDMSRVQRVQPAVGAGPQQGARGANPSPGESVEPNRQAPNARQQPNAAPPPAAQSRPNESAANPAGKQNGRSSGPDTRPASPQPNANPRQQQAPAAAVVQQPNAAPPPAAQSRPNDSPSNPAGKQNGRSSAPDARPDRPQPNANPRQQNAPPPAVVQQPNAAPPPAAQSRPNDSPSNPAGKQNGRSAPREASPPPNPAPRTATQSRPNESPSNPAGKQNGRSSAPVVAKPDIPPPNANTRQQKAPAPNAVQPPSAPPPSANDRSNAKPPGRQQQEQPERATPQAPPNRPTAQDAQRQPPQEMKQAPTEKSQPATGPKEAKGKPDKNSEKN